MDIILSNTKFSGKEALVSDQLGKMSLTGCLLRRLRDLVRGSKSGVCLSGAGIRGHIVIGKKVRRTASNARNLILGRELDNQVAELSRAEVAHT